MSQEDFLSAMRLLVVVSCSIALVALVFSLVLAGIDCLRERYDDSKKVDELRKKGYIL